MLWPTSSLVKWFEWTSCLYSWVKMRPYCRDYTYQISNRWFKKRIMLIGNTIITVLILKSWAYMWICLEGFWVKWSPKDAQRADNFRMVVAWVFYFVYALLGIVVEISCNKSAIYKKINQVPILLIILSENNSLGNSVKKSVYLVCSGRLPLTISFCF